MTKLFFHWLLISGLALSLSAQETNADMESWKYPYPVHYVQLADTLKVAYIDEGSGPVLFFIHGLGSNLQAWKKNIDSLRQDYRCIAIDLPGYGKSSGGDLPYGMPFFADVVLSIIEALELENVGLIGHSMGGQISIHAALRNDPRIGRLALIAPAGFEQFTEAEHQWFANFVRPEFIRATPEAQIIRNFELNFYDMPEDAQFMIKDRMEMRNDTSAYLAYSEMIPQCVQSMLKASVFDRLPELKIPTLTLFGTEDALIPNRILHPDLNTLKVAEAGASLIPDAELYLVSNAGHFVQWEQSEKVNVRLYSFFQSK